MNKKSVKYDDQLEKIKKNFEKEFTEKEYLPHFSYCVDTDFDDKVRVSFTYEIDIKAMVDSQHGLVNETRGTVKELLELEIRLLVDSIDYLKDFYEEEDEEEKEYYEELMNHLITFFKKELKNIEEDLKC